MVVAVEPRRRLMGRRDDGSEVGVADFGGGKWLKSGTHFQTCRSFAREFAPEIGTGLLAQTHLVQSSQFLSYFLINMMSS